MKKIIAAALSVLVGAFGFTIVDTTLENRVATLESQVAELQEYHQQITTKRTTTMPMSTTAGIINQFQVGDYLTEYSNAQHKFLLRMYSNGNVSYIPPNRFTTTSHALPTATLAVNGITSANADNPVDVRRTTIKATTTTTAANNDPVDVRQTTITTTKATPTTTKATPATTTTKATTASTTAPTYKEYFLYITDSSAQITNIEETLSYNYWYGNDYSQCSNAINYKEVTITVKCKGYTDPVFAGKKIEFFYPSASSSATKYINNTINSDGTFEYHAEYVIHTQSSIEAYYAIDYPIIK